MGIGHRQKLITENIFSNKFVSLANATMPVI